MDVAQVVAAEQVVYEKEIKAVKELMDNLGIRICTPVFIYPDYADKGWHAVFGGFADAMTIQLYIFEWHNERDALWNEECLGIRENGTLIRGGETIALELGMY